MISETGKVRMSFRTKLNTFEMLAVIIPYREPPSSKARVHLEPASLYLANHPPPHRPPSTSSCPSSSSVGLHPPRQPPSTPPAAAPPPRCCPSSLLGSSLPRSPCPHRDPVVVVSAITSTRHRTTNHSRSCQVCLTYAGYPCLGLLSSLSKICHHLCTLLETYFGYGFHCWR
jgi:hypothetical protein